jgi:hypothetical protein
MKKLTVLIFALFSFFINESSGQNSKFEIGSEGGAGLISLRGDSRFSYDAALGFTGGISFQYNISGLFSLRTNISYEKKGAKDKITYIDINGVEIGESSMHINNSYIVLPLLARFSFGKDIKFFVNGGPYFGYLIKSTYLYDAIAEVPEVKYDDTANKERFDFGLTAGTGVLFPVKKRVLISLEIRDNFGLSNIYDSDVSLKNNSLSLLAGVAYRFGMSTN